MDRPDRSSRAFCYSGSVSGSASGSAGSARPTTSSSSADIWSGSQSKGHGDSFLPSSRMRHVHNSVLLMDIDVYVGSVVFLLLGRHIKSPAQLLS